KYGVVGHIVNAAARIETFTVGGQVLVSGGVRQTLGDRLVVAGPLEGQGKGVESALSLWEVLALRGEPTVMLPSPGREPTALAPSLEATVRVYLGKRLDKQSYAARVHRLGAGGAELTSDAPLTVYSAVRVHVPGLAGSRDHGVDGKVVALAERDGVPTVVV